MKVCVQGLWHLGTVTASALASVGHEVTGLDDSPRVIAGLQQGEPPVFEPGLGELIAEQMAAGRLRFADDPAARWPKPDGRTGARAPRAARTDLFRKRHRRSRTAPLEARVSSALVPGGVAGISIDTRTLQPGDLFAVRHCPRLWHWIDGDRH